MENSTEPKKRRRRTQTAGVHFVMKLLRLSRGFSCGKKSSFYNSFSAKAKILNPKFILKKCLFGFNLSRGATGKLHWLMAKVSHCVPEPWKLFAAPFVIPCTNTVINIRSLTRPQVATDNNDTGIPPSRTKSLMAAPRTAAGFVNGLRGRLNSVWPLLN